MCRGFDLKKMTRVYSVFDTSVVFVTFQGDENLCAGSPAMLLTDYRASLPLLLVVLI